jgi:amidophosphoribosyltransferase
MPTREELIASGRSTEEIRARLGVDSLGYLSLEGMLMSVDGEGSFCSACFSGNYTAPLVDLELGYAVAGCD